MAELLWKECVDWLVKCNVLSPDHRTKCRSAAVIDLANSLRDGVLLCHLLNNLVPFSVDLREINLRPQMSQYLCVKNIRAFLQACQKVFELKPTDLFDAHMLFDFTDFGRVLRTLSKLSNSPKAIGSGTRGFPSYGRTPDHEYYNDDIYRNLEDLANDNVEEDIYDYEVMRRDRDEGEEDIYEDLCAVRKKGFEPPVPQAPVDKRDYCVRELVMTETNYIEVLNRIISHFMRPLKNSIKPDDFKVIFLGIKDLSETHTGFFSELTKATVENGFFDKLSDCFLHWKEKFVIYGDYCSNLPRAQELVDELCRKYEAINQQVLRCQMEYNEGKFKLRDLLSVPMQRVLKYHLFLAELKKNTPESHDDYPGLERALDSMQDISQYINEVKRDNETLQLIKEIQTHITDLPMPEDAELKDYGRLLRDGELKIKSHCDSGKIKIRYVFLFDRVILMCKSTRGESYSFKEFLNLTDYKIEEPSANSKSVGKDKWSHVWYLAHRDNKTAYTMYAKTDDTKHKWVEAFRTAIDNTSPKAALLTDHMLSMNTFDRPTNCYCCQKLLRGVFYQGYKCITCEVPVHKECIKALRPCGAPLLPPRPTPNGNHVDTINNAIFNAARVKAKRYYRSTIPGHLSFEPNDIIYVINKSTSPLWEGHLRRTEQRGLFPFDHVEELHTSRVISIGDVPVNLGDIPKPPSTLPTRRNNLYLNIIPDEYPWYAGIMDHDSANRCLERLTDGSFLVRISEKQNRRFVISLKHDGKVKHMRVNTRGDEEYYLSELKYFKSIVELVRWHEENSLSDFFQGLETTLRFAFRPPVSYVEPIGIAVANYDFSATSNSMLSLTKGDVVNILSKRGGDKGWWKGQLGNKVGFFPLAYVTEDTTTNLSTFLEQKGAQL